MIPARAWLAAHRQQSDADRRSIAAWLRVPPLHYVTLPFVRMETDAGPALAGITDPPRALVGDQSWQAIGADIADSGDGDAARCMLDMPAPDYGANDTADVILWQPSGAALLADTGTALVGRDYDGVCQVYTDAGAFFRDWAARRHQDWLRAERLGGWRQSLVEACGMPGMLAIGNPSRIRWPEHVSEWIAEPDISACIDRHFRRQLPRVTARKEIGAVA